MKTDKRVALYVPFGGFRVGGYSDQSQFLRLSFVLVDGAERVTNVSDYDEGHAPFSDLALQAYVSWRDGKFDQNQAYETCYRDVGTVEYRDAERMYKMLQRVGKIKFPVRPATFGQYVALTCQALKVKTVVTALSVGGWHNETRHRVVEANYLQDGVDRLVADFAEKVMPRVLVSADSAA